MAGFQVIIYGRFWVIAEGLGAADKTDDSFIADQRSSSPVLGDKGKHPVFNFVPLTGSGREVGDVKVESGKIRQALKTHLP